MDHANTDTPAETILHGALELSKNSWLLALQFPDRVQPSRRTKPRTRLAPPSKERRNNSVLTVTVADRERSRSLTVTHGSLR